jgi:glycosyltransferase involved in cell wall biosynthesis
MKSLINNSVPDYKQIRILHVVDALGVGGLEQVIKTLVLNSPPSIKPYILVLRRTGIFSTDLISHNIPLWNLELDKHQYKYFHILSILCSIIEKNGISVIHCHDLKSWFYCVVSARLRRIKLIMTKHGSFNKRTFKLLSTIKLFSCFTDRIIAVSPDVEKELVDRYYVASNKVLTIINGISPRESDSFITSESAKLKLGLKSTDFVIGTVTRFYSVKNIAAQVELVDQLKSLIPNLAYVIAAPCEGEYYRQIDALIDSMNLRKYFHLLGFCRDIPAVLSALDVFVLTSLTEGTSMALLEAMQSGLPAIVSEVGGNSHVIKSGHNGFLYDLNSHHKLRELIMLLYNDPALRHYIGNNAIETASTYSVEQMAAKYRDEYCKLYSKYQGSHAH